MNDPAFSNSPNPPAEEAKAVREMAARLQSGGRYAALHGLAQALLSAQPERGAAWIMLGDALHGLERYEEAVPAYQRAFRYSEAALEAVTKLGVTLGALGRTEEGIQTLDGALALAPENVPARFQRGLLRLTDRDFAQGWDDYEARWRAPRFIAESRGLVAQAMIPDLTVAPSKDDLEGKRVLLIGEQGIGDQVMFASMIPDLAAIAARVVLVCEPRLVHLFRTSFPQIEVLAPAEARVDSGAIDRVLAMGSLGSAFRRAADDFPGQPYLAPRAGIVEEWTGRLGPRRGAMRVGLCWRGGSLATRGKARSVSLAQLAPIVDLPGIEVVSLQHGDVAAEIEAFNEGRDRTVRTVPAAGMEDFESLAGLVANLDVVVSVQTSLIHLCGATGADCLTLVPRSAEWRYMAEGETMPWYGSVELIRQSNVGEWAPVVDEAVRRLEGRLAAAT